MAGPEKGDLPEADLAFHEKEYERLVGELEVASEKSELPESSNGKAALNELLVRVRMEERS